MARKPLTVGFHEAGFAATLNGENRQPFWFQLSAEERQQVGSPWGPSNPQALNRYSYVENNPITQVDPTGHWLERAADSAFISYDLYDIAQNGLHWENGLALAADVAGLALPVVTGGGLAVRAAMHAADAVDALKTADKAADAVRTTGNVGDSGDSVILYRSMKEADDGLPLAGPTSRTLGSRPGTDIPVDSGGMVQPNIGGMSVSPSSPAHLPSHRRPPTYGGTGKDPVWCIKACDLGPDLQYRPDPQNPSHHGFIEPARRMPLDDYQHSLANTRGKWQRLD
ncbi:MAG: hypothetical protein MI924_21500 [Chloroflexales bacterium]|nr:hypothetical protein [Chloroflexales bacterium]